MVENLNSESILKLGGKKYFKKYKCLPSSNLKDTSFLIGTSNSTGKSKNNLKAGKSMTLSNNLQEWELNWCLIQKNKLAISHQISKYWTIGMEEYVKLTLPFSWCLPECLTILWSVVPVLGQNKECQLWAMLINTSQENLHQYTDLVKAKSVSTVVPVMMNLCWKWLEIQNTILKVFILLYRWQ